IVHLDFVLFDSVFHTSVLVNLAKSNPGTRTLLELYLLPLTIAIAVCWLVRWRRDRNSLTLAWAMVLCFVILMHISFVTGPLSDLLSLMTVIQFPFRFYIVLSFAAAVWVATASDTREEKTVSGIILVSGIGILAMAGMFCINFRGTQQPPLEQRISNNGYEYTSVQTPLPDVSAYCLAHANDPDIQLEQPVTPSDTCFFISSAGNSSFYRVCLSGTKLA